MTDTLLTPSPAAVDKGRRPASVGDNRPSSRRGAAALVLHEELSDPAPVELPGADGRYRDNRPFGCRRWPEGAWLRSNHGELVPGRCGSTNLCDYCARLGAVENTEMLALDAAAGEAPALWCVLTTRTAALDMRRFYRAREQVVKAVRRRWPHAEYACLLEFTTGYGPRAGGQRRPHWNMLWKGVPVEARRRLRKIIVRVWCGQVDAAPRGQYVGEVKEAGGLMRYIALHFQKESQAPPRGFRGQRFNCSRGYFTGQTRAEARAAAKDSLWRKRQLHKAIKAGFEGAEAEAQLEAAVELRESTEWEYVRRSVPTPGQDRGGHREHVDQVVVEAACAYTYGEVRPEQPAGRFTHRQPDWKPRVQPAPREPFDRGRLMARLKLVDRWARAGGELPSWVKNAPGDGSRVGPPVRARRPGHPVTVEAGPGGTRTPDGDPMRPPPAAAAIPGVTT